MPIYAMPVIGPVYPIAEEDALVMIERRLREKERSGELATLQREAIARAKQSVETPAGRTLPEATTVRSVRWDPSIRTTQPIADGQGGTLVAAGTRLNPLEHVALSRTLVFFDGRSAAQSEAVARILRSNGARLRPIMVAGSPTAFMRTSGARVYFDQHGKLIARFGITALPAVVRQDGNALLVQSLPPAQLAALAFNTTK